MYSVHILCLLEIILKIDLNLLSSVLTGYNVHNSLFHHVTGPHCETCASGYFGNAKNGGTCKGTVIIPYLKVTLKLRLVDLNCNFECDWLIELSGNKLSDNNLASELVKNRSFLKPITIEEIVIFIISCVIEMFLPCLKPIF